MPLGFAEGEGTDLWSEVLIAVGVIDVIEAVILYLAFSPMVSNQEMAKHCQKDEVKTCYSKSGNVEVMF